MDQSLDSLDQTRWYKFAVQPESRVVVTLTGLPANYDLVLYKDNKPAWQAENAWSHGNTLKVQSDGNVVLYDEGGHPVWASNTEGNDGAYLAVQDDGNAVVYDKAGEPIWATNTGD